MMFPSSRFRLNNREKLALFLFRILCPNLERGLFRLLQELDQKTQRQEAAMTAVSAFLETQFPSIRPEHRVFTPEMIPWQRRQLQRLLELFPPEDPVAALGPTFAGLKLRLREKRTGQQEQSQPATK